MSDIVEENRIGMDGEDLMENTRRHLFLEIWTVEHGIARIGQGCGIMPERIYIDFPTYTYGFDEDEGTLRLMGPLYAVGDADLIVGTGRELCGDLGGGISSTLDAVKLPYTATVSILRFRIMGIEDGCVQIKHRGKMFRLCPGESRSFTGKTSRKLPSSLWSTSPDGSLDIKITTRVTNHGFVKLNF